MCRQAPIDSKEDNTRRDAYDKIAAEYAVRVDEALYNAYLEFSAVTALIDNVFIRLVEQAAARGLLDFTYAIDSTHVEATLYNDAISWNYGAGSKTGSKNKAKTFN